MKRDAQRGRERQTDEEIGTGREKDRRTKREAQRGRETQTNREA